MSHIHMAFVVKSRLFAENSFIERKNNFIRFTIGRIFAPLPFEAQQFLLIRTWAWIKNPLFNNSWPFTTFSIGESRFALILLGSC